MTSRSRQLRFVRAARALPRAAKAGVRGAAQARSAQTASGQPSQRQNESVLTHPPASQPMSWASALLTMSLLASALWIVALVNTHQRFNRFGLRPRKLDGLQGIVLAPFLHTSFGSLLALSGPFVILGWAVLISGVRVWLIVSALVVLLWGGLSWAVAPSGTIVGVSGLTAGWMGYLLARAYFSRRVLWILGAFFAALVFSGVFAALVPAIGTSESHVGPLRAAAPWQANLCGLIAGIIVGWLLHPRRNATSKPRRPADTARARYRRKEPGGLV